LRALNFSREHRHRQIWFLIASLLFFILITEVAQGFQNAVIGCDNALLEHIKKLFFKNSSVPYHAQRSHFLVFGNLLILWLFCLVKFLIASAIRLSDFVRYIIYRIKRGKVSSNFYPPGQIPSTLSFAYEYSLPRGVLLKKGWVYPGMFTRHMALMLFFVITMAIFSEIVHAIPVSFPEILACAFIFFLEMGWYLDGDRPLKRAGDITGKGIESEIFPEYERLWKEYQEIWPNRYLFASTWERPLKKGSEFYFKGAAGTKIEQELSVVWESLKSEGYNLDRGHAHILKALWEGKDIIINEAIIDDISPVLFALMRKILIDGDRILLLTGEQTKFNEEVKKEVFQWLQEGIGALKTELPYWTISDLREFKDTSIKPDILVVSTSEIDSPEIYKKEWFKNLKLLVIPEATATVPKDILPVKAFAATIKMLSENDVQIVVMDTSCDNLEPAMRKNIPINPQEFTMRGCRAKRIFSIAWKLEGSELFQETIMSGETGEYLGAEPILSLLALKENVDAITLLGGSNTPLKEHVEEVAKHLDCLNGDLVPSEKIDADVHSRFRRLNTSWLARREENNFIFIRDDSHNLASTIVCSLSLGKKNLFVHSVSPSYMLRDYFADNIEYFVKSPLFQIAPCVSRMPVSVAYPLLFRMVLFKLPEEEILNEIRDIFPTETFVEESLPKLFLEVFGIDIIKEGYLEIESRCELQNNKLVEKKYFGLSKRIKENARLKWLRFYKISDDSQNLLALIRYDHLYQTYLPDQIHSFNGKPYQIRAIDEEMETVRVTFQNPDCENIFRTKNLVSLKELKEIRFPDVQYIDVTRHDWRIRLELCEADFVISTSGYYSFPKGVDLSEDASEFNRFQDPITREYEPGRALIFTVATKDKNANGFQCDNISLTMTLLLNEMWCSVFPETYRFLIACCPYKITGLNHDQNPISSIIPVFDYDDKYVPGESFEGYKSMVTVYLFEDSHLDMGLLQAFFENWHQFMELLDDYLAWLTEDIPGVSGTSRKNIDDKCRYLKFGFPSMLSFIDLENTKKVLEGILMGENRLSRNRKSFSPTEREVPTSPEKGTMRQCDFCGRYIKETELERLEDGRERCSDCRRKAINTLSELKEVLTEAKEFMEANYKVKIVPHVNVRFATAAEIQKERGIIFTPTPEFDPRAIGLAVRRGNNEYEILVENGQPYHMTIEVIVHELTHIWQFVNLDVNKMLADYDKVLIEGHAMWAGITCLEIRHMAPSYVESQKQRDDEYGKGYWTICELIEKTPNERSPFRILRQLYPKEGK